MYSRQPIPYTEAIQRILNLADTGEIEEITLADAFGRVLADDVIADHAIPPFNRSAFDGYAIRSEDTLSASFDNPIELMVTGAIAAGEVANGHVSKQEAMRIMTGAELPPGADAILALELAEQIEKEGQSFIRCNRPVTQGMHVAYRGEDVAEETVVLKRGRSIDAGMLAILATFGYAKVKVYQLPTIGLFVTGSELLPVESALLPGKIRNSNAYMLMGQLAETGANLKYYGILADNYQEGLEQLQKALTEVDVLITTGGASVGDYDFVQDWLNDLGAEVLFNKVAMRPGSVTTVGKRGKQWIFGLSGNPAACFVGFELFTRPVIRAYQGVEVQQLQRPRCQAKLTTDINKINRFTRFMRAAVRVHQDQLMVTPIGIDKSSIISSLAEANALLIVPPTQTGIRAGESLEVILFSPHTLGDM